MATTVLNGLILQASRMVQEVRTSAAATDDTGRRWKSAMWTDYVNKALRDLLRDALTKMGAEAFMAAFPEYVKTSGVLTLVSGSVAKPTDALQVFALTKSDLTVEFQPVPPEDVAAVKAGTHGLFTPTTTTPVFWDENGTISTLGLTSGNVVARYIVTPADLAVITSAAGNGKKNSANGQYTAATKLLQATMGTPFAAGDENRPVMFYDNAAGKVYFGAVSSVKDGDEVYLTGDGLPTADVTAGNVTIVLLAQIADEDVKLNRMHHGELLERVVKYALSDTMGMA